MNKKLNGHSSNGEGGGLAGSPTELARTADQDGESTDPDEIEPASSKKLDPPPQVIADLAASCVRFVERSVGLTLDYTAETLPLLDHYLADARRALLAQSETDAKAPIATLPLLSHAAGAYFGEVLRRRYSSWWRAQGDDPMTYRVELSGVYLAVSPMLFIYEALARGLTLHGDEAALESAQIEMDEEDQKAAAERLALLEVDDDEYYAPSTRLEAIDVCVDTIRSRRMADGDPVEMALTPEDYET